MDDSSLLIILPFTFLVGGFLLAALSIHRSTRLKELAYRERIAMIEKGIMPSPETDPERFDAALDKAGREVLLKTLSSKVNTADPTSLGRGRRRRDAGVILMGVGLGLGLLILGTAGTPAVATGIGGAFAVLGAAFMVNGFMMIRDAQSGPTTSADNRRVPPSSALPNQ